VHGGKWPHHDAQLGDFVLAVHDRQVHSHSVLALMTRLYLGKFGDAGAASFVRFGIEPGGEDLFCEIVGECAVGKAQHIGVVPHSGAGGLPRVGA
jgi:hypothetical protein